MEALARAAHRGSRSVRRIPLSPSSLSSQDELSHPLLLLWGSGGTPSSSSGTPSSSSGTPGTRTPRRGSPHSLYRREVLGPWGERGCGFDAGDGVTTGRWAQRVRSWESFGRGQVWADDLVLGGVRGGKTVSEAEGQRRGPKVKLYKAKPRKGGGRPKGGDDGGGDESEASGHEGGGEEPNNFEFLNPNRKERDYKLLAIQGIVLIVISIAMSNVIGNSVVLNAVQLCGSKGAFFRKSGAWRLGKLGMFFPEWVGKHGGVKALCDLIDEEVKALSEAKERQVVLLEGEEGGKQDEVKAQKSSLAVLQTAIEALCVLLEDKQVLLRAREELDSQGDGKGLEATLSALSGEESQAMLPLAETTEDEVVAKGIAQAAKRIQSILVNS
ncbi:hypothetical protein A3770_04p29650 [Chloropicon primus]|uniref:Uncharacterized protein n=2 Tax=Chloropicon primus TaxID=1764295 RepID=A0A5B8MJ46_9CHLO|nr:hypothetical protein A3770_04p29650 [Chloropicon primus]|eukprot:QDZ20447.1 hypothetical protein A3770_04p29650 [Chloropicon primus]